MDREIPNEIKRKQKIKKYSKFLSAILVVLVGLWFLRFVLNPGINIHDIRLSVVEMGTVEASVSASGVVVPEFEQVLISPIQSKIDRVFLTSGDPVKAGEPILELNTEFLQIEYDKLKNELELQKNKKEQLDLKLQQENIDSRTHYDIKELQTQFVESQLNREKYLFEIGGGTKENLQRAELNYEIARRELEQLANQIENQQASNEAELKELDIMISIKEKNIEEIRRQLELAEARAERDGVITWINDDIGSSVNKDAVIARIADLGSFKIEARVSEIHAGKLQVGGPVKVRTDGKDFTGHISSVQPAVENGIVKFFIDLDSKSDESLRSNLRVDVFVITSLKDNVLRVENGPFYSGSVDQKIFVIKGDRAVRRIVDVGETNFDYAEIQGDIDVGDTVIISDMTNYHHMDEIDIDFD